LPGPSNVDASLIVILMVMMMMVLPATMPTVIAPPAVVAPIACIAVTVVRRSRCIDHGRRCLIDDRRLLDIHGRRRPKVKADVHVSERGAGGACCAKACDE
jgi:hypothetical protein